MFSSPFGRHLLTFFRLAFKLCRSEDVNFEKLRVALELERDVAMQASIQRLNSTFFDHLSQGCLSDRLSWVDFTTKAVKLQVMVECPSSQKQRTVDSRRTAAKTNTVLTNQD